MVGEVDVPSALVLIKITYLTKLEYIHILVLLLLLLLVLVLRLRLSRHRRRQQSCCNSIPQILLLPRYSTCLL